MKVSITGTFSVPRNALENALKDAGHEVVSLSKKTDRLLIGEKTASKSKIDKAEQLGIQIIREADAKKILSLIGTSVRAYVSAYVSMYEREEDIEAGKTIKVGISNLIEVYSDFRHWNADCGEWMIGDMERVMVSLTGGNGRYIEAGEVEKILREEIGVKIEPEERVAFLTGFYRLTILDFLPRIIDEEGDGMECEVKEITSSELMEDEFYSKIFNFLHFFEEEDKNEAKKLVAERIKEMEIAEKNVGTVEIKSQG